MIKKFLWNKLGQKATHAMVGRHLQGSRLDIKLGFALFRDRRVPMGPKLLALALAGALTASLVMLELSPEAVLGILIPFGFAIEAIADGMEVLVLPLVFAGLLLPFLAPRPLVDTLMAERAAGAVSMPPAITP